MSTNGMTIQSGWAGGFPIPCLPMPLPVKAILKKPKKKALSVNDAQVVGRREGFVVKLHGDHFKALHIACAWFKSQGTVVTPEAEDFVNKLIPSMKDMADAYLGWRSIRIRAKDVQPVADFLDMVTALPFACAYTMRSRARALRKIDVNDLLADAAR